MFIKAEDNSQTVIEWHKNQRHGMDFGYVAQQEETSLQKERSNQMKDKQ